MSHYLVYWQIFDHESKNPYAKASPDWSTDDKSFYDTVRKNDVIWVVVNGGKNAPNEWRFDPKVCCVRKKIQGK